MMIMSEINNQWLRVFTTELFELLIFLNLFLKTEMTPMDNNDSLSHIIHRYGK